jgi:cyclomaltodextrinase
MSSAHAGARCDSTAATMLRFGATHSAGANHPRDNLWRTMRMQRVGVVRCLTLTLACAACARSEQPSVQLVWTTADADVWAFRTHVEARTRGSPTKLDNCVVQNGARAFPARVEADHVHADIALNAGPNTLRARCRVDDGRGQVESGPLRYQVRLSASPIARAVISVNADTLVLDASGSAVSDSETAPLRTYDWTIDDIQGGDVSHAHRRALGEAVQLTIPKPHDVGRVVFRLTVTDALGRAAVTHAAYDPVAVAVTARWPGNAVVYGVLPPLFGAPPLRAVASTLDSIAALGVDTLWLAPLFDTPADDFGYAVTDYFRVRPDYGDAADLHAVIDGAHRRGLRVILDLPANHTARAHAYFAQASALGQQSRYFGYYARDAAGAPSHYFDWEHLPNLNYENPEVVRFMLAASAYWLSAFEVDGYRLDAAWGVRQRTPAFWPLFAEEMRRARPELFLLAEAPASDSYYTANGFDAAYDWTADLGKPAWEHVFDRESGIALRLSAALRDTLQRPVFRFLNNNDTGARFITRHGLGLTRVATAALLTLPGIPCLYSFDEVGAPLEPYGELHPVTTTNPALRTFHARWIALRRREPALSGPGFELLHASERDEVLAYLRFDDDHVALVLLSFSARPTRVTLQLPQERFPRPRLRDLMSDEVIKLRGRTLVLTLAGWQARVLGPD